MLQAMREKSQLLYVDGRSREKGKKLTSRNTIQVGDRLALSTTELLSFFGGFLRFIFPNVDCKKKKERIGSIGRVGRAANPVPKIHEALYYYSSGRLFV